MSTALPSNEVSASAECPNRNAEGVLLRLPARVAVLGEDMTIRRALPNQGKRMVGAWCFLDHAGPVDVSHGDGMRVGPVSSFIATVLVMNSWSAPVRST